MSSKSKSTTSSSISQSTQQGLLFILHYKSRRVLVGSPKDYGQLQVAIRRHFPEIPVDHRVSYHTDELAISKGALVEVSEDIWETAIALLSSLTVQSSTTEPASGSSRKRLRITGERGDSSCDESPASKPSAKIWREEPTSIRPHTQPTSKWTFDVRKGDKGRFQVRCKPSTPINTLWSGIRGRLGEEADDWRAVWQGSCMDESSFDSVQSVGMEDGAVISLIKVQRGGKPVIYLFPPSMAEIDASVRLSLVPEWHFSGIYPVVPVDSLASGGQALQWNVKASSCGTLLEKNTGLEVAYLFWEAEAPALLNRVPLSDVCPPSRRITTEESFVPTHAQLEPSNSVVLEVAQITPYLDSVLKVLGLHTEARTSFITYWLPSLLKHTYIALRFLPQRVYERAAPLKVTPAPDVVVRVFMLFKGLKLEEVSSRSGNEWNTAIGDFDVDHWKKVVGIDEDRSLADKNLFRVLEWGGMEVLS